MSKRSIAVQKYDKLQAILVGYGSVAVAFSGGVDSTLLLQAAYSVLKDNVLALFSQSIFQSEVERNDVLKIVKKIGCQLKIIEFDHLADKQLAANSIIRCYYCKKKIYSAFFVELKKNDIRWLADGSNISDLTEYRPGQKAIIELGVKTPLVDAGLTKSEIREISKNMGLPTWDKPSSSCLATRISHNEKLTQNKITIVGEGEKILHRHGLQGCRLRISNGTACIELTHGDHERFFTSSACQEIKKFLKAKEINKFLLDLSARECHVANI